MVRICKEENFHHKQGYEILATLMKGTPEQQAMAQDSIYRWWWPSLMMFGPPDKDSPNSAELLRWKVKRYSNDELRQRFIDRTVPQAENIGIKLPDPELKWNEEKQHYNHGEINWEEFFNVIAGRGICNRERMHARKEAHENGAWVREAAEAYAKKKESRQIAA
jgi:ring-1,2-phenylacetyl-CoA epoxidase subunit PaaA